MQWLVPSAEVEGGVTFIQDRCHLSFFLDQLSNIIQREIRSQAPIIANALIYLKQCTLGGGVVEAHMTFIWALLIRRLAATGERRGSPPQTSSLWLWWNQSRTRGGTDWVKVIYSSQCAWVCESGPALSVPCGCSTCCPCQPTPSGRNSMSRSLATGKHQANQVPGMEGRTACAAARGDRECRAWLTLAPDGLEALLW